MRLAVHAASATCTVCRSKYIVHVLAFSVPLSRVQLIHELDPVLQVLLLLPMRSTALRVVTRLCELAQKETRADSIQNKVSSHKHSNCVSGSKASRQCSHGMAVLFG